MDVLFVSRDKNKDNGSRIYRCVNQAKQLISLGTNVDIVDVEYFCNNNIKKYDIIIISRCIYDYTLVRKIIDAKKNGTIIGADIDDRIYMPWDSKYSGYVISSKNKREYKSRLKHREDADTLTMLLLPFFDFILASTKLIANDLSSLGYDISITPNVHNDTDIPLRRKEKFKLRKILYMSGTATHQSDFKCIEDDIYYFMNLNSDIELTFLGKIIPPSKLFSLKNVGHVPLVCYNDLHDFIYNYDVVLVPLNKNIFNDAKSNLKFIESGAMSVPVIASKVDEYKDTIINGKNGFVVEHGYEWIETLNLLKNEEILKYISIEANETVFHKYTISSCKHDFYQKIMNFTEKYRYNNNQ